MCLERLGRGELVIGPDLNLYVVSRGTNQVLRYNSVTGAFLDYVASTSDHEIAVRMNEAMREGRYSPDLWKEYTGKTVDELWSDYVETLKKA